MEMLRRYLMLAVVLSLAGIAQGKIVDIKKEVANVLKQHNGQRSSTRLKAADMLEMTWDDDLAVKASEYAERCRYQYPNVTEFNFGFNLYYQLDVVYGQKSIHRLVNKALKSWIRSKDYYVYGPKCDVACSYVQMIMAQTDKVGCAVSTCSSLVNGDIEEGFSSIFVCFYSPRQSLSDSYPYKTGFACSECPAGAICKDGLCSQIEYEALPAYLQDSPSDRYQGQRQSSVKIADTLTDNEQYYIRATHNRLRESSNRDPLEWDPYLERWTNWIVNCQVDYPGPAHCYTNFHRLDQGAQVYSVVYEWQAEGENVNLELDHGCRTPNDITKCNHLTNVLEPSITSIACAAKDCKDNTRQLVCIYDNKADREIRNSVRPFTYRRRNRRHARKQELLPQPQK